MMLVAHVSCFPQDLACMEQVESASITLRRTMHETVVEAASLRDQLRDARAQLERVTTEAAELRATLCGMAPRSELAAAEARAEASDAAMAELSAGLHASDSERGRLATQLQVRPS